MRQISSRPQEESDSGWLEDAADASSHVALRSELRAPRSPQSTTAPKDFTAQVMARLSTPPPPPDPRLNHERRVRARAGLIARVYITLVLAAAVAIALMAVVAPGALITLVASLISGALLIIAAVAFIGRATGGFVSGLGVIYAAMLAALTPSLIMLARRLRRQRPHRHQ